MSFNEQALKKIQNGVCPYCNRGGFMFTISHIVQKHNITPDGVREEFGINPCEPLCTPEHSAVCAIRPQCHSEDTLKTLEEFRHNQPKSRRAFAPQARKNHVAWLLSDRHREIARTAFGTPQARARHREWAETGYLNRVRLPNGQFA